MKYFRDFLKIVVFVLIMYVPLSWLSRQESIQTLDKLALSSTFSKLQTVEKTTQMLLEKGEMIEACQRLTADITATNITTFNIIGPEGSCNKPDSKKELPPIENGTAKDYFDEGVWQTFKRNQTGPYNWSISVLTPQKINIWNQLQNNVALREEIIKDLIIVIYLVFAFLLCAVLIFAESIQNRYKQNGKDPMWLKVLTKTFGFLQLNDMKVIQAATGALIKKNEELNKDLDLLQTSLEASILNEIKTNNHNIPYSFYGTVSKVDINGFSKVVASGHSHTTAQMTMNLENFGCELLRRYEGLFEKTIGDEIVVVFKGGDSQMRATAFSRDLMAEFSSVKFNIDGEERQFTLKSAIYSSEITFSKRSAGYGFLGDALTFTTRLMDAVSIKEKNILSIIQAHANDIQLLIQIPSKTETFKFKNMADQNGYQVEQFTQLDQILNDLKNPLNQTTLNYFKSDFHIIVLLNHLVKNQNDSTATDLVLNTLLNIQVNEASEKVSQTWQNTIREISNNLILTPSHYAKLVMLGKNLVPKQNWTENATQTLLQISRRIEGRINASIIDVLMDKDLLSLESLDQASFRIANDPSGRTQANMIVFRALRKLDNKIFDDLIEMIKSSQSHISKSGIYAACQIIDYYRTHSPAELETYASYHKTSELLLKIKNSSKIKLSDRLQDRLDHIA